MRLGGSGSKPERKPGQIEENSGSTEEDEQVNEAGFHCLQDPVTILGTHLQQEPFKTRTRSYVIKGRTVVVDAYGDDPKERVCNIYVQSTANPEIFTGLFTGFKKDLPSKFTSIMERYEKDTNHTPSPPENKLENTAKRPIPTPKTRPGEMSVEQP